MKSKYLLLFGLCLASVQIAQASIINPGFESCNLSPWYDGDDQDTGANQTVWSVTSTKSHSGSCSATNIGNLELRQDFSAIDTNQIASVTFWQFFERAATNGGSTSFSAVLYYSDGFEEADDDGLVFNSWVQIDITSYVDPGRFLTGIGVYGAFDTTNYLDDFAITMKEAGTVPEPGSLTLLGLGLAGLAATRRRRH